MSSGNYSTNERAERIMGRRLTPEEESGEAPTPMPMDFPCELGYWCPIHRELWDEGLAWSEYNCFLWCPRCDKDYPSALCVPVPRIEVEEEIAEANRNIRRMGWNAGIDDAIKVYLDTVEQAILRTQDRERS